jgi:hypothetical protein
MIVRFSWLAVLVSGTFVNFALAQAPVVQPTIGPYVRPSVSPYYRPAFSPYLNLGRGGNPAVNYYGLVRPQQQFATSIQQLREADTTLFNSAASQVAAPETGVQAGYMNFSHYYGNRPTGTAALRPATMPPAVMPPALVPPLSPAVPRVR